MGDQSVSRRTILGAGAAGITAGVLGLTKLSSAEARARAGRVKNIIFMVSDGMSPGVLMLSDHYLERIEGRRSFWRGLMSDPTVTQGLQDTRSISSLVTDSSAASSAWGSGQRIWNGQINILADGTSLRPLYDVMKRDGKMRTGLVTTATITHATPAGFSVSMRSRGSEAVIAEEYLKAEIDVLIGGGDSFFDSGKRGDKRDLYGEFRKAGYTVARTPGELKAAPKLLGILASGHLPYEVDRRHRENLKDFPSLAELTRVAIDSLRDAPNGFILQIEGARVDHAAHANDFAGLLLDQVAFDDAVRAAVEFARHDGETLVIVTSDHANANPGLLGAGGGYFNSTAGIDTVPKMTASYEWMMANDSAAVTSAEGLASLIETRLGIQLTARERELALSGFGPNHPLRGVEQYDMRQSPLSLALSNHTHICWSGRQHTSDLVLLSAVGPGRELFAGVIDNCSVFERLLSLREIEFKNPGMSFEEAQKHQRRRAALDRSVQAHWMGTVA